MKNRKMLLTVTLLLFLAAASVLGVRLLRHPARAEWELTQYACASGNNACFYSLYNPGDQTLYLLDGGWTANAEQVRQVIREKGGRVKAWFLTHYHEDHIGAFNAVYPEFRDRIEAVYATPLDWETFEPSARDWDSPETFRLFLDQTEGDSRIHFLHRDDTLDIPGFHVQVFNAWDQEVQELVTDYANNCPLVLQLTGRENSVLFLGDMSDPALGNLLLERYGDQLHADFVQAAHHGNWGQKPAFYERLRPSVLFFDAPEWLMVGDTYDARELKKWCDSQGITTCDYRTAPNRMILR